MSAKDNVTGRKAAEAAFELASDLFRESNLSPDGLRRAWTVLGEMIDGVTQTEREFDEPEPAGAMTDAEATRFEFQTIKFGKHQGEQVMNVPLSYLAWIDEDEFRNDLRRYLKRREIWDQQEVEDE